MQQCATGVLPTCKMPLDNEHFYLGGLTTGDEARLDIKAGSFWKLGQNVFFDVHISHINSTRNRNLLAAEIFDVMKKKQNKKKLHGKFRVSEAEHATFIPLVFGINGGVGRECALFTLKIW